MGRISRILAPVDFSECSRASLGHALSLGERFAAPVDVLHVWELPTNVRPDLMVWIEGSDAKQVSQIASEDASRQMDALLATLAPDARARVTARLEGGDPIEAILRVAQAEPFDLIVMGTHGRRGLSHFLIGSVAEKVVRQASIPVSTVRTPAGETEMRDFRKILVPVDFSESSRLALDYAAGLAAELGATLHLLHVWEIPPYIPPEAMVGVPGQSAQTLSYTAQAHAEHQMKDFAEEVRRAGTKIADTRLESGDAARTIVDVADGGGFDLIVMGTHGRTGLGHLLMGSVAEKVIRRAHVPVLTVPSRKRD